MFTVLLDAPAEPGKRIQIAKLGTFRDPRYGEFEITAGDVADWQRNLSKLPGGEALIDFEHRSERKPRDSKAAGWISAIDLDGDRVMAATRWTPGGEQAIRSETYRFLSPTFGPALGADNEPLDNALPSVALTNKPVLGLPALMLASQERVSEAIDEDPALRFQTRALDGEYGEATRALVLLDVSQAERDQAKAENNSLPDGSYPIRNVKQLHAAATLAASKHGDWKAAQRLIRRRAKELGVEVWTLQGFASEKPASAKPKTADSRAAMAEIATETLLKTLELPEDADEQAILAAIAQMKGKADERDKFERQLQKKPKKTLEQEAKENGLVILDAAEISSLRTLAQEGADAKKQLHQERFDRAFEQAVKARKVTPAQEDDFKRFYELDADTALKTLDNLQPILPERPLGNPAIELDLDTETDPAHAVATGRHPESAELDRRIRKYMLDNKLPDSRYVEVFEQVQSGAVVL